MYLTMKNTKLSTNRGGGMWITVQRKYTLTESMAFYQIYKDIHTYRIKINPTVETQNGMKKQNSRRYIPTWTL